MSIIYCDKHSLKWDSDFKSECPACENESTEQNTRYVTVKTTQKPWVVDAGEAIYIRSPDGSHVAIMGWLTKQGRKGAREVMANARLIASAPDLLSERDRLLEENKALRAALAQIAVEAQRGDTNPASSCNRITDRALLALAKVSQ